MATDVSKNVFELFSGKKRTRWLPTLAITVLVTGLVAIPLILIAVDARNNPVEPEIVLAPGDAELVMVSTGGPRSPLDLSTVSGPILVSLQEEEATAVSFNLFAAGADQAVVESQDLEGPQFDFVVGESGSESPFDSTLLMNGEYELFVTIRTPKEDRRTAVSFTVQNP